MGSKDNNQKSNIRNVMIATSVILFFLGVIIVYYAMLYSETKAKIIKIGELSSVSSAAQIDKYLSTGSETLKLISYSIDTMIRSGSTSEEIQSFLENQTIAVANTNPACPTGVYGYILGEYLDGTLWVPEADYIPTERPWYIDARANIGRVAVVDPYVDAMTGVVIVTFCKTLCDAKSVASMDFSMERLQIITEEIVAQGDADMEIVLDQKYQVIAHSDKEEVGKSYMSEDDSFGSALVEKLRTSSGEGYFSLNYKGADYIVYDALVANDWFCLSVYDATKVFGQLRNTLGYTIIASIIVVFILLVIMINSNRKEASLNHIRSVVEALAASIDAKDAYTKGHSSRVADYAREISRRHGDSEAMQEEIHMMGLLHDVGKIGIPDAVINKPGRLNNEEFDLIKSHPDIGSKILSKTSGMAGTSDGVRWHHERFDGKGYPDGLSGYDIPEKARIIAVADSYDAMTSKRSYRNAMDQEVVRKEIEKGKGTQFDPEFADIMIQMIDEDKDYHMNGENE